MNITRTMPVAAVVALTVVIVAGPASAGFAAADARAAKPVITSVEPAYGSSVGYAHLVIRGRHLTGGKVTVAGRSTYARVINAKVIAAFPAGHHHGTRYKIVVRTKAGTSNVKRYEFRYARQPGRLRAAAAPAVPGGTTAGLAYTVVRCATASTCVRLGADEKGPVARVTTRGRTFVQRIPVPSDYARDGTADLVDLACPSATFCAAVGSYNASSAGLFSTWNGSTWTSRRTPDPAVGTNALHDLSHVSCGAASRCAALDEQSVYTLNGAALTVAAGIAPAGYRQVTPDRVSCPAAGWCAVVGSGSVGAATRNFVAIGRGTIWTTRSLANPSGATARFAPDLDGLDCAYADRCTVLAGGLAGGAAAPLWFGRLQAGAARWTKVTLPADAKRRSAWAAGEYRDASLDCPSSRTCFALAAYSITGLSGQRGYQPVVLRLQGAAARVFAMPRPASSRTGRFDLADLSCATPSSCVAVGTRGDSDVNDIHGDAIVETYAAGVWTPVAAPSPAGRPRYSGYEFTSIDCAGVARCSAVGDYNYDHDPDAEDGQPLYKARPVLLDIAPR